MTQWKRLKDNNFLKAISVNNDAEEYFHFYKPRNANLWR